MVRFHESEWFVAIKICFVVLKVKSHSEGRNLEEISSEPVTKATNLVLVLFCLFFIHFIIPFGKFGPPYLGKTTAAAGTALSSPTSACWVFSCFCNPQSSDMDYRILNMRT